MNRNSLASLATLFLLCLFISSGNSGAQSSGQSSSPFLGWNSYNCYGTHINKKLTRENLEAFIQKLKPYGYEYFVLDAGWYRHHDLKPGETWPTDGDKVYLQMKDG